MKSKSAKAKITLNKLNIISALVNELRNPDGA
jgi:hypothetical protein